MAKTNKVLTEAEWLIIEAVWEREPCAAPMVQEALENRKNWSYSTVKTMMDRMVEKGLLKTKRIRNLIMYSSAITRSQARTGEVMRTLKATMDVAAGVSFEDAIGNLTSAFTGVEKPADRNAILLDLLNKRTELLVQSINTTKQAADKAAESLMGFGALAPDAFGTEWPGQTPTAPNAAMMQLQGQIAVESRVKFENAPPGTKVEGQTKRRAATLTPAELGGT